VVGSGGHLLTARRDPRLALRQRERLEAEGVVFDPEGRVAPGAWWFSP
jgi:alkylated DNA nucleotide flippase Atl1